MKKLCAEDALAYLVKNLLNNLEELRAVGRDHENQFAFGEKTAYVECLEMLCLWVGAEKIGLDADVERCFPLI